MTSPLTRLPFDKTTNTSPKVEKCSHESKSSEESFCWCEHKAKRGKEKSCRHWFSHFPLWKLSKISCLRSGDRTHTPSGPNLTHFRKKWKLSGGLGVNLELQKRGRGEEVKDTRLRIYFYSQLSLILLYDMRACTEKPLEQALSLVLMISKTLECPLVRLMPTHPIESTSNNKGVEERTLR